MPLAVPSRGTQTYEPHGPMGWACDTHDTRCARRGQAGVGGGGEPTYEPHGLLALPAAAVVHMCTSNTGA